MLKTRIFTAIVVLSNVLGNFSLSLGHAPAWAACCRSRPGLHCGAVQSLGGAGRLAADLWLLSQMALLSWADLSYVLPVTSVGYVLVALAAGFSCMSRSRLARWAGIALIMAGVMLVSRTAPQQPRNRARPQGPGDEVALVAIIVLATTIGEVLQAMGMKHHGEIHDFRPGALGRLLPAAGAESLHHRVHRLHGGLLLRLHGAGFGGGSELRRSGDGRQLYP